MCFLKITYVEGGVRLHRAQASGVLRKIVKKSQSIKITCLQANRDFSLRQNNQTASETHPASHSLSTGDLPEGQNGRNITMTNQFHLVPNS